MKFFKIKWNWADEAGLSKTIGRTVVQANTMEDAVRMVEKRFMLSSEYIFGVESVKDLNA